MTNKALKEAGLLSTNVGRPKAGYVVYKNVNFTNLASACNVSTACICRVMQGRTSPGVPLLRKMAEALGESMDSLDAKLGDARRHREKVQKGESRAIKPAVNTAAQ